MAGMELAPGWPVARVRKALSRQNKSELVTFFQKRHEALFFEPLQTLFLESDKRQHASAFEPRPNQQWQFGFAITALCCLLIETFQSYRAGLPSSNRRELDTLQKKFPKISKQYQITKSEWPSDGGEVFRRFFLNQQKFFPGIDGDEFYQNIRNGLLHQAQTKFGWRIRIDTQLLWENKKDRRVLNRNLLVDGLCKYFKSYQEELLKAPREDKLWQHARRKIWWLAKVSVAKPQKVG